MCMCVYVCVCVVCVCMHVNKCPCVSTYACLSEPICCLPIRLLFPVFRSLERTPERTAKERKQGNGIRERWNAGTLVNKHTYFSLTAAVNKHT